MTTGGHDPNQNPEDGKQFPPQDPYGQQGTPPPGSYPPPRGLRRAEATRRLVDTPHLLKVAITRRQVDIRRLRRWKLSPSRWQLPTARWIPATSRRR